jgi:hypothetical protein
MVNMGLTDVIKRNLDQVWYDTRGTLYEAWTDKRWIPALIMDATGAASGLAILVGEATDVAYAPLQTGALAALYWNDFQEARGKQALLATISFVEEIIPLGVTDLLPTALITHTVAAYLRHKRY